MRRIRRGHDREIVGVFRAIALSWPAPAPTSKSIPTRPAKWMACSKRPAKAPHPSCILDDWLAGATFKRSLAGKKRSFCRPSRGWQNRKRQTQKTFRNFCERSELSLLRGHGWGKQDPPAWQTGWGWCFASQITLLLTGRVGML